jgi:hypothetical protein
LDPRHKGSQPRVANAAVQDRIARRTQQKLADGSTHWSCRKRAETLKLSKSTVQRVWAQTRLKPHRLDSYMASDDPRFEEKAADIIGLYLNPPQQHGDRCRGLRQIHFCDCHRSTRPDQDELEQYRIRQFHALNDSGREAGRILKCLGATDKPIAP